ncbi:MAG TPA: hypothetical protein VHY08_22655 [Bacillota bacterium]|nr:hypothetical protein [Bacillota bacterium]
MKKYLLSGFFVLWGLLLVTFVYNNSQAALLSLPNKIFFTSYRDGNAEIYSMKPDGSSQTRLTNNTAYDGQPSCSADTNKFVFVSDRAGNKEIYSMNSDGASFHRITYHPANDLDPALSADGTKIAFVSDRDGGCEIYTMAFNGSGLTRLTFTSTEERYPAWSPDGTMIAFSANNGVWVMNADGSNVRSVTNLSGPASQPSWSPQGDRIAFGVAENGNSKIYVIYVDGSGLIPLINDPAYDRDPSWSPNGNKIVFTSNRSGANELYVMNAADGSGITNLTNNPASDEEPCWGGMANLVEQPELISNPNFDIGIDGWHCICLEDTTANAAISWDTANYNTAPGSLQVRCADNGGVYKDIQLLTSRFNLVKDTMYLLTFKAKSSASFTIPSIKLNQAGIPWSDYANPFNGLTINAIGAATGATTTGWQSYAAIFTANATVSDARLTLFLGNALPENATFNIDTVSLKKITVDPAPASELLPNPSFDTGVAKWNLSCDSSALAYRYLDANDYDTAPVSYMVQCMDSGNTLNSIQLFTMPLGITAGKNYQLSFKAKCSVGFAIPSIRLMKATSPWTNYAAPYSSLMITNDWQTYTIRFAANTTTADGRITFFLGNALPDGAIFKIDSVSLSQL